MMGWTFGLRARIAVITIETWLSVIASWLSPYPWYVDLLIVAAVDCVCVLSAKHSIEKEQADAR
jgi:hypothetical protein